MVAACAAPEAGIDHDELALIAETIFAHRVDGLFDPYAHVYGVALLDNDEFQQKEVVTVLIKSYISLLSKGREEAGAAVAAMSEAVQRKTSLSREFITRVFSESFEADLIRADVGALNGALDAAESANKDAYAQLIADIMPTKADVPMPWRQDKSSSMPNLRAVLWWSCYEAYLAVLQEACDMSAVHNLSELPAFTASSRSVCYFYAGFTQYRVWQCMKANATLQYTADHHRVLDALLVRDKREVKNLPAAQRTIGLQYVADNDASRGLRLVRAVVVTWFYQVDDCVHQQYDTLSVASFIEHGKKVADVVLAKLLAAEDLRESFNKLITESLRVRRVSGKVLGDMYEMIVRQYFMPVLGNFLKSTLAPLFKGSKDSTAGLATTDKLKVAQDGEKQPQRKKHKNLTGAAAKAEVARLATFNVRHTLRDAYSEVRSTLYKEGYSEYLSEFPVAQLKLLASSVGFPEYVQQHTELDDSQELWMPSSFHKQDAVDLCHVLFGRADLITVAAAPVAVAVVAAAVAGADGDGDAHRSRVQDIVKRHIRPRTGRGPTAMAVDAPVAAAAVVGAPNGRL
jgi:hypothetical protein